MSRRTVGEIRAHDRIAIWHTPYDPTQLRVKDWAAQTRSDPKCDDKPPNAIWYAFGTEWIDWCRAEDYARPEAMFAYRLRVDRSRLLVLPTEASIVAFAREYGACPDWMDRATRAHFTNGELKTYGINWARVRERYAGVEIPRYCGSLRYSGLVWYYTWDVATGCVWDPSAVLEVTPVLVPKRQRVAS